jgi:hypothetical protein
VASLKRNPQDVKKAWSSMAQQARYRGRTFFRTFQVLSEAKTQLGARRVSARRGRAGENGSFFNILLS